jgi:membrane protein
LANNKSFEWGAARLAQFSKRFDLVRIGQRGQRLALAVMTMSLGGGSLSRRQSPSTMPTSDEIRPETLLQIIYNVIMRVGRDNLMLVAAGVAFYAMTAIFPAIAAFVSIYGLFADPATVPSQVAQLAGLFPGEALKLVTDALQSFSNKSQSTLSFALLLSVALAIWSAKAGISSLMTGLNITNETIERRGYFVQQLTALALTFGAIIFAAFALGAIALLPALASFLPLTESAKSALALGRWPILVILICFALAILYRFGPYRERAKWRWITLGSATATMLLFAASLGFSLYVSRFGTYDKTYGSLAAPVVLLMWFWLSGLVVLLGSEIDAEMEHADGKAARSLPDGAP